MNEGLPFILGFFLPLFWVIGALVGPTAAATRPGARRVESGLAVLGGIEESGGSEQRAA